MNPDTGEIKTEPKWVKDFLKGKISERTFDNLVPFEIGEIVELKGCIFKVRVIKEAPQNFITLEGIARKEKDNAT